MPVTTGLRSVAALVAVFIALALPACADPSYPARTGPVVDAAHVLSASDVEALTGKVLDLEKRTGVQLEVATVPSLDGQDIAPYANGLFRDWKIGQKGVDNGLLLVLAPKERALRFEVGRGLEGSFTDLQSTLILHNTMVPKLKAGDPAGALKAGVDDAITVLTTAKADLPKRLQPPADDGGPSVIFFVLFAIIVVVFIILMVRGRGLRYSSGWGSGGFIGSSAGSAWSSGDSGSFGGSDSSSGGGDFSGGGGGDSGGGGASDSY